MGLESTTLHPSRCHQLLMTVVFCFVCLSIATANLGWLAQALVLIGFVIIYRHWARPSSVMAVGYDQSWYYIDESGEQMRAELCANTLVTRYCVILHLKDFSGQSTWLPVFYDSLSQDQYRRLKVILHTL